MKKKIKYFDLGKKFKKSKNIFYKKISFEANKGQFILGPSVINFEKKIKKFVQSKYVISCANGSDAIELCLTLMNLKIGDEIITTSNTWISVGNAILNAGAKPVFADINNTLNIDPEKLEKLITKKTKCIIITHLNGLACDAYKIKKIAKKYNIKLIEDCSQAIGSTFNNIHVGNFGCLGTFSMHPTKNLGLFGDGGFIVTNNKNYFKKLSILRNHGLKNRELAAYIGRNSRLDTFQAIAGLIELKKINIVIKKRIKNANLYEKEFKNLKKFIQTPLKYKKFNCNHTFHRYVILCKNRNGLYKFLNKKKIEAKIHYPLNIHQQTPFKKYYKNNLHITNDLNKKILSLPIHEYLKKNEIMHITSKIKEFYLNKR